MLRIRLAVLVSTAVHAILATSQSWNARTFLFSKHVTDGLPVSLECRKPPPGNVGWYRYKEGYVSRLDVDPRIQISAEGTLYFSFVDVMDTAVYKCGITASSTIHLGSPVQLNVTKGKVADTWPVLQYSSEKNNATLGQEVTLQCIFSGRPVPVVTWYHDDLPMTDTTRVKVSYTTLTIKNVSEGDAGMYRCTGKNEVSSDSHDVTLIVADEPRSTETSVTAMHTDGMTAELNKTGLHQTTAPAMQSDGTSQHQIPGTDTDDGYNPAVYTVIAITCASCLAFLAVVSSVAVFSKMEKENMDSEAM